MSCIQDTLRTNTQTRSDLRAQPVVQAPAAT